MPGISCHLFFSSIQPLKIFLEIKWFYKSNIFKETKTFWLLNIYLVDWITNRQIWFSNGSGSNQKNKEKILYEEIKKKKNKIFILLCVLMWPSSQIFLMTCCVLFYLLLILCSWVNLYAASVGQRRSSTPLHGQFQEYAGHIVWNNLHKEG